LVELCFRSEKAGPKKDSYGLILRGSQTVSGQPSIPRRHEIREGSRAIYVDGLALVNCIS
jgi:hypothetical protein